MKCRILHVLILALLLTGCGEWLFRDYFRQGQERYDAGDYAGAYEKWYVLAKQGNADAQVNIGDFYQDFLNPKLAVYWYEMAEKKGSLRAQLALGDFYLMTDFGIHTSRAEEIALAIINVNSEMSIYERLNAISGSVDKSGFTFDLRIKKAIHYYSLAAERGFSEAQFRLGKIYDDIAEAACNPECGADADANYLQSVRWLELAAKQGHKEAQRYLGYVYFDSSERVKDFAKSIHWLRLSLDGGILDSGILFTIGNIYAVGGYGVIKDEERAMLEYWGAASLGHLGAMAAGTAIVRKSFPELLEEGSMYGEIKRWVDVQENVLAKQAAMEDELEDISKLKIKKVPVK